MHVLNWQDQLFTDLQFLYSTLDGAMPRVMRWLRVLLPRPIRRVTICWSCQRWPRLVFESLREPSSGRHPGNAAQSAALSGI